VSLPAPIHSHAGDMVSWIASDIHIKHAPQRSIVTSLACVPSPVVHPVVYCMLLFDLTDFPPSMSLQSTSIFPLLVICFAVPEIHLRWNRLPTPAPTCGLAVKTTIYDGAESILDRQGSGLFWSCEFLWGICGRAMGMRRTLGEWTTKSCTHTDWTVLWAQSTLVAPM